MRIFKWEMLKILRDWKVRILLLALLIFLATFSSFYQNQNVSLPLENIREQYSQVENVYYATPEAHLETEVGQYVDELLAENQWLLGMQRYILNQRDGNTVDGMEELVGNYVEQGMQINENILTLHAATDFESYDLLVQNLPSVEEAEAEMQFLTYLSENEVDIDWNPMSPSLVLFELINTVAGIFLFIVAAVMGADRFSLDQERNWSITQGIPLSWHFQWRMRTFINWMLIWIVSILGIMISYFVSTTYADTGTLLYPVQLYGPTYVEHISVLSYVIIVTLLVMILSYLIIKLSVGLSWVFRNIYLTIAIVVGVFFIPYIFTVIPAGNGMNPLLYLQIEPVLNGFWDPMFVNIPRMIVAFLLIFIIIEVLFFFIFKLIPTRTGKLERRKN